MKSCYALLLYYVNYKVKIMNKLNTTPSPKAIYFWNTLGGLLNAAFSVVIMIILTHVAGIYAAGIFSLGYSNAMMLQHVGSFDSRSYQCSTFNPQLRFQEFLSFRLFTSILMVLATIILIFSFQYHGDKALVTMLLSFLCIAANISDIFQGNAQKVERLDLAGKSLSYRIILSIILFFIALIISNKNLVFSILSMVIFSFCWIIFFDTRVLTFNESIKPHLNRQQFNLLFTNTFPLFLSLFSQVFIFNMPKYAIDSYMSVEAQAIYGVLFMPASIVSLLATFLYRPIMVQLSIEWENRQYSNIIRTCVNRILIVFGAIFLIVIGGALIGTQVLTLLYGTDVTPYKKELIILLIGGGFSGISVLLYYLMTIVHKQHYMVFAHFVILCISWFLDGTLVKQFNLYGATLGYLLAIVALDLILFVMLYIIFHNATSKQKNVQEV